MSNPLPKDLIQTTLDHSKLLFLSPNLFSSLSPFETPMVDDLKSKAKPN